MDKLQKEVADGFCRLIEKKRNLPSFENLDGKMKHGFENEFNTLFQTLGGLQFEDVSKQVLKKLCWAFAVWGANNLNK